MADKSQVIARVEVVQALDLGIDAALKANYLPQPLLSISAQGELTALNTVSALLELGEIRERIKGLMDDSKAAEMAALTERAMRGPLYAQVG